MASSEVFFCKNKTAKASHEKDKGTGYERQRQSTELGRFNSPFPSSSLPLCQNESKCETIQDYENVFNLPVHFHAKQTHFYMESFARGKPELGNGLFTNFEKKTSRYFIARSFKQKAGSKQDCTRKCFKHLRQDPFTSSSSFEVSQYGMQATALDPEPTWRKYNL